MNATSAPTALQITKIKRVNVLEHDCTRGIPHKYAKQSTN